jgi:sigma-B regulation protein RsbU (phosphoserine phosphatase)
LNFGAIQHILDATNGDVVNALTEQLACSEYEILNALSEAVYITDLDRKILFWNDTAEQLTGWSSERIVGSSCFDDILAHVDIDGHKLCGDEFCPLRRAITTNEPNRIPEIVFAQRADGSRIPVEVTVAPLRRADGKVIGGIESFRDLGPLLADLQRARQIQDAAMSSQVTPNPAVTFAVRSIPNEYVSGDFSRIEHLGGGTYAFMVADVMGHGVSAALHTMQISSLWLEERSAIYHPAQFMTQLNRALSQLTRDEDFFASAVLGIYNAESRRLTYANAGHPHPLLCQNGTTKPLAVTRPALGLLPNTTYIAMTIELCPGDRLLLYTDGCTELNDAIGVERGTTGLSKLFDSGTDVDASPETVLNHLIHTLLEESGAQRFPDDVTLLTMHVH